MLGYRAPIPSLQCTASSTTATTVFYFRSDIWQKFEALRICPAIYIFTILISLIHLYPPRSESPIEGTREKVVSPHWKNVDRWIGKKCGDQKIATFPVSTFWWPFWIGKLVTILVWIGKMWSMTQECVTTFSKNVGISWKSTATFPAHMHVL